MRISDWSSDVCSSDLAELATIIAKMAAKMSNMPPALSLSRKSRKAERGGKLRVMGKLFPYFVSRFDNNRPNGVGFTHWPYRSEEHTSELQSLMRISYAVFCLQNNIPTINNTNIINRHV